MKEYVQLFEENGWEHLLSKQDKHYFRRIHEQATEDIFSDMNSKVNRYKQLFHTNGSIFLLSLGLFWIMYSGNIIQLDFRAYLNPETFYFTPGLWELNGLEYWWAFLFETPIAVMRGYSDLIFTIAVLAQGVIVARLFHLYKRYSQYISV